MIQQENFIININLPYKSPLKLVITKSIDRFDRKQMKPEIQYWMQSRLFLKSTWVFWQVTFSLSAGPKSKKHFLLSISERDWPDEPWLSLEEVIGRELPRYWSNSQGSVLQSRELCSYWSSFYITELSLVENFIYIYNHQIIDKDDAILEHWESSKSFKTI